MTLKSIIRKAISILIVIFWRTISSKGQRRFVDVLNEVTQTSVSSILSRTVETIQTSQGEIKFYSVGKLPSWRAQTLLTKEPETIEWIDGFADDAVF